MKLLLNGWMKLVPWTQQTDLLIVKVSSISYVSMKSKGLLKQLECSQEYVNNYIIFNIIK